MLRRMEFSSARRYAEAGVCSVSQGTGNQMGPTRTKAQNQARDRPLSRWPLIVLALIVIAGGAFRLFRIDVVDLTRDEAFSWRLIRYDVPELIRRTSADVHPPLYYLALKGWVWQCGASIVAMRVFSALLGVASIVVAYCAALEAFRLSDVCRRCSSATKHTSALLAAGLLAFNSLQIEASRTARMYPLGVFLAVFSSWTLLRASGAQTKFSRTSWWSLYGLTTGLFCLTHNFALFTFAAQVLFVGTEWLRAKREDSPQARHLAQGWLLAAVIAAALYMPWVPALVSQFREVRAGYWIPPMTWSLLKNGLVEWTTGIQHPTSIEGWLILLALGAACVSVARWRDRAGWFFAVQAVVPWLLCLAIGKVAESPIFQIRYMVLSQVAMFGLGAVVSLRSSTVLRGCLLATIVGSTVLSSVEYSASIPAQLPASGEAMRFVQQHYEAGDVIVASSQRTVNRLLYYSSRVGMSNVDVRCVIHEDSGGHVVHMASLTDNQIIWGDQWSDFTPPRLWHVYDLHEGDPPLIEHMKRVNEKDFTDDQDTHYIATLYVAD